MRNILVLILLCITVESFQSVNVTEYDSDLALIYAAVNESLPHRLNKLKVTERMLQLLTSQ